MSPRSRMPHRARSVYSQQHRFGRVLHCQQLEQRRLLSVSPPDDAAMPLSTFDHSLAPSGSAAKSETVTAGFAATGEVSLSFNPMATAVQADGKILVAGDSRLERFNSDGSADTLFGDAGLVALDSDPTAIAVEGDGRIIVGGSQLDDATGQYSFGIWGYASNGAIDKTFGATNPGYTLALLRGGLNAMTLDASGHILAAGSANGDLAVERFLNSGFPDTSFGGGNGLVMTPFPNPSGNPAYVFTSSARGIALAPNGTIVAAGGTNTFVFDSPRQWSASAIAIYNPEGTLETALSGPTEVFNATAGAVVAEPDNTFLIAQPNSVAHYNSTGALDATLGTGAIDPSKANPGLALEPSGSLLVAGIGGAVQLTSSGSLDTGFGNAGYALFRNVNTLLREQDGRFLLAGPAAGGGYLAEFAPNGVLDATPNGVSTASATSGIEGVSAAALTGATFTDANTGAAASDFTVTAVNWGDGGTSTAGLSVTGSNGNYTVGGSHLYADEGSYSFSITIKDAGNNTGTITGSANVVDAALSGRAAEVSATEEAGFSGMVATFIDSDSFSKPSDFVATINWDDGTSVTTVNGTQMTVSNGTYAVAASHVYALAGTYQVAVSVADAGGKTATVSETALVSPASTNASGGAITGTQGVSLAATVATFNHGDGALPVADFSATIDWGDGTVTNGTVTSGTGSEAGGAYRVVGTHAYAAAGTFTVATTISEGGISTVAAGSAVVASAATPAPTANTDTFVLGPSGPYSASGAMGVLANDTSADEQGQNLVASLASGPSHGTLSLNRDGSFAYTPDAGFQGIDRFTYQVSEGVTTGNTVTVTLLSYNASLVDKFYQQVLHRSAEDAGLIYWTGLLDQGQPLDVVATGIFNSTERLNPLVAQFYEQYLSRETDPSGLAYWVKDWQTKGDPRDVVESILASKEFFDDAGDANSGFVALLYQRVLQRQAEASGLGYWLGLMSNPPTNPPETRTQIASQFYDTHEKHVDLVDFLFGEYFNGASSLPSAQPYVADLDQGQTETQVEKAIIDSSDYRDNPPEPAAGTVGRALYPN